MQTAVLSRGEIARSVAATFRLRLEDVADSVAQAEACGYRRFGLLRQ
jgi:hypothetical protein